MRKKKKKVTKGILDLHFKDTDAVESVSQLEREMRGTNARINEKEDTQKQSRMASCISNSGDIICPPLHSSKGIKRRKFSEQRTFIITYCFFLFVSLRVLHTLLCQQA